MREPLWIASVKVVTGPFGYSGFALRVFTTGLSIVALFVVWLVVRVFLAMSLGVLNLLWMLALVFLILAVTRRRFQ